MATREYYVIQNPAAARGAARRGWEAARAELDAARADYRVVTTETRGHAAELAARAADDGWPAVVAVGGDGTVHEVANGLLAAAGEGPTAPLGIIAVGSGNDFVKLVGLPLAAPREAVRRLVTGSGRQVDVGRMNGEYFTNGVGIGFDARVAAAAQKVRRLRGMAIYAWGLVQVLASHRTPRMRVVLDGEELADGPLTLVTVGNGGCHGGGFWICPDARIDDGLFDVCVADAMSATALLGLIPYVMRGKHVGRPGVAMRRAARVEISSPEPLPIHADGEVVADAVDHLTFELLPARLTVIA